MSLPIQIAMRFSTCWHLALLSLFTVWGLVGCNGEKSDPVSSDSTQYEVDEGSDSTPTVMSPSGKGETGSTDVGQGGATGQPPVASQVQTGGVTLPNSVDELFAMIKSLRNEAQTLVMQANPQGQVPPAVGAKIIDLLQTQQKAAEKLLTLQLDTQQRLNAIDTKFYAMGMQAQLVGDQRGEPIMQEFIRYAQSLARDEDPKIAIHARVILLGVNVQKSLITGEPNAASLLAEARSLLASEERGMDVLQVAQSVVMALRNKNQLAQADELFAETAEAFKDSQDPEASAQALEMVNFLELNKLGFDQKLNAVLSQRADALQPFVETMKQALQLDQPGPQLFQRLLFGNTRLEQSGNREFVKELATLIGERFGESQDEEIKKVAEQYVKSTHRRIDLIGQPLEVTGATAQGTPLNWSAYRGKVVLLVFWISDTESMLTSVRETYDQYHDRGFEVIGVAVDQNPQLMSKHPWPNLVLAQYEGSLAETCGLDPNLPQMLPLAVLIDQSGKVVDIHTLGDTLKSQLDQLLGTEEPAPKATDQGDAPQKDGQTSMISLGAETTMFTSFSVTQEPESSQQNQKADPTDANPYRVPNGLSTLELIDTLFDMEEKPKAIRKRPGFVTAMAEAADRILSDPQASDRYVRIAARIKLKAIHFMAAFGEEADQAQLRSAVTQLQNDPRLKEILKFYVLEQRVLESEDLPEDQAKQLLSELAEFFAGERLEEQHLRIASSTVRLINQLEDDDQREEYFAQFGKLFAKSQNLELAAYGRKLAKPTSGGSSALVGKPLELAGEVADGSPFDWAAYRGKVVLVDFWATWCGPCRREMPHVQQLHKRLAAKGFDVVGVSLDKDLEAAKNYLKDNQIPWQTLLGEATQELAQTYGVRAIPTMMLVDPQGKIVAVAHNVKSLEPQIEALLAQP